MAQTRKIAPHEIVVPILQDDAPRPLAFLGTGFFVGPGGLLLTCAHVVAEYTGRLFVTTMSNMAERHSLELLAVDHVHDLAVGRVHGYQPTDTLACGFGKQILPNLSVLTFDYGTTQRLGRTTRFNPATRMGNVTRVFDGKDIFGEVGDQCLELSFPALRGASGAPVVNAQTWEAWGVIVANASYELMPAQVERVYHDDDRLDEEIKYMLPQAIAVNIMHAEKLITPYL